MDSKMSIDKQALVAPSDSGSTSVDKKLPTTNIPDYFIQLVLSPSEYIFFAHCFLDVRCFVVHFVVIILIVFIVSDVKEIVNVFVLKKMVFVLNASKIVHVVLFVQVLLSVFPVHLQ
jgi:hypothetical protein